MLTKQDVLKMVEALPDNVEFYTDAQMGNAWPAQLMLRVDPGTKQPVCYFVVDWMKLGNHRNFQRESAEILKP